MHRRALSHSKWREIEETFLPKVVDSRREAVDVGANVGRYSVALARLARRVYAFEPDAELCSFLASAAPANLTVFQEVLSDSEGTRTLHVPLLDGVPSVALAAIGDAADDAAPHEVRTVQASTLDRLADRDIGFVKIDVEGHEFEVLVGGRALIERQRPIVLVEVEERHKPGSVAGIAEFFDRFEYVGFFVYDGRTHAIADFTVDMQDPSELARPVNRTEMRYVNNFLFVPSHSVARGLRADIDAQLRDTGQSR